MSDFFREAIAEISGDSWLDDLARASWRAAEEKFSPDYVPPAQLRVSFPGVRDMLAYDSYLATKAIQTATAKLGHIIRNPRSETSMAHAADRVKASLMLRSQSGNTIIFGFPEVEDKAPGTLPGVVPETLAVRAARELVSMLPSSAEDDAAIDAVLAQRETVRNAVDDIVKAVPRKADGLSFELSQGFEDPVSSILSQEQAGMLRDSLQETRTARERILMPGRLDGVRTKRRIFYLEPESGGEIHGALDLESLEEVRANLNRQVIVRLEREQIISASGRRAQPLYRLLGFEPAQATF